MTEQVITVQNKQGVHARPASMLVQKANGFKSAITIKRTDNGKSANAKSILTIMSLGITKGTEVALQADGPDEADAIKALVTFIVDEKMGDAE